MKIFAALMALTLVAGLSTTGLGADKPYPIVGTGQNQCYDSTRQIEPPAPGQPFYGQDAQHPGLRPAYKDNGDGTISDLNTGLMWVKERGVKATWEAAMAGAKTCSVGGYNDWRAPAIKELYSLIDFRGGFRMTAAASVPYLDTRFFGFAYGDESRGERGIDCQDWSATEYVGTTMSGNPTVFGVNFADGRIKGYPKAFPGGRAGRMYIRYVRGNGEYGKNDFHDSGDGIIADRATGLEWSKADGGKGMNWQEALAWVQARNKENYLGHNDWRLPNAKELESIVDYTRAPQAVKPAQRGPAIDPVFQITKLRDGEYPFFWSSTTHLDGPPDRQGGAAIYVAFGRALGWMSARPGGMGGPGMNRPGGMGQGGPGGMGPGMPPGPGGMGPGGPGAGPQAAGAGNYTLTDVHGAGAQRSDPKAGNPAAFPHGRGPQGDVIRIYNFVRLVRNGAETHPPTRTNP